MSTTAAEQVEQISPPAEILDIQQFRERARPSGDGSDGFLADSTQRLREGLSCLRKVCVQVAAIPVRADHHREVMRESAAEFGKMARSYYDLRAELIEDGLPEAHPAAGLFEEVATELEDIAESMALSGSKPFARLAEWELAEYIPGGADAQT